MIDYNHFTPLPAFIGGTLIGLAAALLMLTLGRILGVSGIVGGLLGSLSNGERCWRLSLIAGMLAAPLLWQRFAPLPEIRLDASPLTLIVSGLLVGIGTRYAAGCTSGHGVCGLSRLSLRSLVATLCFMATGFVTMFIVRHLIGA